MLAHIGDQFNHHNPFSAAAVTLSPFHSSVPAPIPVQAYFVYVSMNAGLSDHQSVIALVLIERLCNRAQAKGLTVVINSLTIHR
jgi:hypothetical protein